MYVVPAEDPSMIDFFKGKLTEDPLLQSAATLSAKKWRILKDPSMNTARKRSLVQQLNPKINSLIRRMRQLPAGFSSIGKSGDLPSDEIEEEEDLVTPVQQKLLQRILKNVNPLKRGKIADPILKEEEVTPIKPRKRKKISKKKLSQQLPFYGEELPRPDYKETVDRTLRKLRKKSATPLAASRLRTTQGWESWDPKQRTKKRLTYSP